MEEERGFGWVVSNLKGGSDTACKPRFVNLHQRKLHPSHSGAVLRREGLVKVPKKRIHVKKIRIALGILAERRDTLHLWHGGEVRDGQR